MAELVATAWAAASSFRGSDKRGGANGARIRLEPPEGLEGQPARAARARAPRAPRASRSRSTAPRNGSGKRVSLADLIVLAGNVGVETAAKAGGVELEVPFTPGARGRHTGAGRDAASFAAMEPTADGFRNYLSGRSPADGGVPARRPGEPAHAERPGDDRARRRPAGARGERRRLEGWRPDRPAGDAHQRLLREPAGPGHGVVGDQGGRGTLRGQGRLHDLDRDPGRPRVRLELGAPRASPRSTRATT